MKRVIAALKYIFIAIPALLNEAIFVTSENEEMQTNVVSAKFCFLEDEGGDETCCDNSQNPFNPPNGFAAESIYIFDVIGNGEIPALVLHRLV